MDLSLVKNEASKNDIMEIMSKHMDLRSRRLGTIKATHHSIDLKKERFPIHQQLFCTWKRCRELLREYIGKHRTARAIKPAQSEWASSIILVFKKDGTLYICVDYRHHNAASIRDTYPLARINDCIDSLGEVQVFIALGARNFSSANYWWG